ncbi:MAG: hypothetical protein ACREH3_02940 [Geminicoccales bacterium]
MIIAAVIMLVVAVVVLAFVLEPVIRARQDQVEIDAAVGPERLPDFRELLLNDVDLDERPAEQAEVRPPPVTNPEPAERRS